jgi:uncharacterized protein
MRSSPRLTGQAVPPAALSALAAIVLAASGLSVPASATSASATSASATSASATSASATSASATSASATSASRARGPGAKARPAASPVLEVGDSLGIDLGWGLTDELAGSQHRLVAVAVGDTGLAEPSYYDWPAQLAVDLRLYHPGTVVVFLGANDVESFYSANRFLPFGSPGWAAFYAKRVAKMMDVAISAGAKVLWVGMPPMEDPSFSSDMATLNVVYRAEALAHRPDVSYYASWRVLGGPQGQYRAVLAGPDGEQVVLRAPDGVHVTRAGGDLLAKAIVARLKRLGWL